jgi:hypothetical protein
MKSIWLEQCAGQSAKGGAESGAQRGEESLAAPASIGANVQQLRRNGKRFAEKVGIDAVEAGKPLQGGDLVLIGCVGEGKLVLLGLIPFRDGFLARESVGEFAEAGGVAGSRDAIGCRLLQQIEGTGDRALRLRCDGGLLRGAGRDCSGCFDTAS